MKPLPDANKQEKLMDERITELEIRITHMEDTIDTLNQALVKQYEVIDELQFQITVLEKKLKAYAEESPVAKESEETPPPHY